MALFRKVIGKTCDHRDCSRFGQSAELSLIHCSGCRRRLAVTKAPFRAKHVAAFATAAAALVGLLQLFRPYVVQLHVNGSTADAGTLSQLGARLRAIYHDCQAGEQETAAVAELLERNPALAQAYPEFQRTRLSRVLEACQRVRSGQLLVAQKLLERAHVEFLKATEEDPENANAWAALGGVCMLTGREEDARKAYERALTIEPESWTAHYNYGCYFARKGEAESALGHLERAVSLLGRAGRVDRTTVLDDLRQNPALGALRQDPRFTRLIAGV